MTWKGARRLVILLITVVEWLALIIQLVLILQNGPADKGEAIIRFFSYFTILTNSLVAISFTAQLTRTNSVFHRPGLQTAITLYIFIVGLVYWLALRQSWSSRDLQFVIHETLHTLVPLLCIFYWWKWTPASGIPYSAIPSWLLYPALYAVYILARGFFSGWYPYPFMDVNLLGYPRVLQNSGLLVGAFLLFSFLIIWVGKKKSG